MTGISQRMKRIGGAGGFTARAMMPFWSRRMALVSSLLLGGCVYPMTTEHVMVTPAAGVLAEAERSVMFTSPRSGGYINVAPFDESMLLCYFPPGSVVFAPGAHRFSFPAIKSNYGFILRMQAGHSYRCLGYSELPAPNRHERWIDVENTSPDGSKVIMRVLGDACILAPDLCPGRKVWQRNKTDHSSMVR
jgi:hypothetical protein